MNIKSLSIAGALAITTVFATSANAATLRVDETNFLASAGQITFSEFAVNTINPVFTAADYGGDAASPTVTTGGFFAGQSLSVDAATDCPGAAATACVIGTPDAGLSIDAGSPNVFITNDGANPTTPVLSGSPRFNGAIALLFSTDQFGVGFDAGFFDDIGSTGITAFARDGSILGTVVNEGLGIEFLGLVSEDADIAGVFLDLVGAEGSGFAIDNLRFGVSGQVTPPDPSVVPLPAGFPLLLAGLGAFAFVRRRKEA